ncbi:MAG: NUDIX hydrolase [Patescibacteria group bacterium]
MKQMPEAPALLLLQRGYAAPTFPGHWGAPGGLTELGETRTETAVRETLEEIGIVATPDPNPFYEGEWVDRDLSYFTGDWHGPEVLLPQASEVCGYGFFLYEHALALHLSFKYREAIQLL